MENLTIRQAYLAMGHFLEEFYKRTNSDDVAVLLGEMDFREDGMTADPAAWEDWLESVKSVLASEKFDHNLAADL